MDKTSDLIVTVVLCLLAVIAYLGFSGDQKERLEKEMNYHEEVFERARESNRLMGCFRTGYLELYLIDGELMTSKSERAYLACLRK